MRFSQETKVSVGVGGDVSFGGYSNRVTNWYPDGNQAVRITVCQPLKKIQSGCKTVNYSDILVEEAAPQIGLGFTMSDTYSAVS